MKKEIIIVGLLGSMLLQSCALIFSGTHDKIHIKDGNPNNAKVLYNGSLVGNAPQKVKVSKKGLKNNSTVIKIEADGYKSQEVHFTRRIKVGALIGDCLTGFIWLIPDFLTGAIYKASPQTINYDLQIDQNSMASKIEFKVGDAVIFTSNDYKNQEGVVKVVYPNRLVISFKKKPSDSKEREVEVPYINISKK
jgi:transcription antitermination factor NusG